MNTRDKILLSDLNLAEYTREATRWTPSGEIVDQDDLLLTRGSCPFPTTCTSMCLGHAGSDDAHDVFDRIETFYRERKSPFSIHLRTHADKALEAVCRQEKMIQISDAPGMVLDQPLREKAMPDGLEIRRIADADGIRDFAFVTAESYQSLQMPTSVSLKIFAVPARLIMPQNDWVVAYAGGKPVSAAMTLLSHGIAGLYWVGTLESFRGKGYAEACVRQAVNQAFERGAAIVVLQASKFGAPLYERMGFQEITRYRWYISFQTWPKKNNE